MNDKKAGFLQYSLYSYDLLLNEVRYLYNMMYLYNSNFDSVRLDVRVMT